MGKKLSDAELSAIRKKAREDQLLHQLQHDHPEITSVEDAPAGERLVFQVVPAHCQVGTPKSTLKCPAATALVASDPTITAASVRPNFTVIVRGTRAVRYANSANLRAQTVVVDQGGDFAPDHYALRGPTGTARLGARPPKPRGPHTTKAKPRGSVVRTQSHRPSWVDQTN
jgi:hypothetical protein